MSKLLRIFIYLFYLLIKAETNRMNIRYLFIKEYLYSLRYLLIWQLALEIWLKLKTNFLKLWFITFKDK